MTRTLRLGDTEVNRIGLGTNRLALTAANVEFIEQAAAAGVNVIDTAHLYTAGDSERTIGAALSPPPPGCVIGTKGGFRSGEGRPDVLAEQIEESLRRLRTDTIELYYLHRVDPKTPLETSLGTINEYRDRGRIRHVGLSEVGVEEIERACQVVPSPRSRTASTSRSAGTTTWSTTASARESCSSPSFRSGATAVQRWRRSPTHVARPPSRSRSRGSFAVHP